MSRDRKLAIVTSYSARYHSDSMNIGRIANQKVGDERVHKTAKFAY